jgi:uncharacterized protein YprB with RNaseH-like and TPR domain
VKEQDVFQIRNGSDRKKINEATIIPLDKFTHRSSQKKMDIKPFRATLVTSPLKSVDKSMLESAQLGSFFEAAIQKQKKLFFDKTLSLLPYSEHCRINLFINSFIRFYFF